MMTKDEALAQVDVLDLRALGRATDADANAALACLEAIGHTYLSEKVRSFRQSMAQRQPLGGMSQEAWLMRDASLVRGAVTTFAFPDSQAG